MQHMPLIKFMCPSQTLIIKNYLCKISDRKYLQLATANEQLATSNLQQAMHGLISPTATWAT